MSATQTPRPPLHLCYDRLCGRAHAGAARAAGGPRPPSNEGESPAFTRPQSGSFAVHVRADSIRGAILGTSEPREIAIPSFSEERFRFTVPVDLEPETLHYLEVVRLSGDANLMLYGNDPSSYDRGTFVLRGRDTPAIDSWFRIGKDSISPVQRVSWSTVRSAFR